MVLHNLEFGIMNSEFGIMVPPSAEDSNLFPAKEIVLL